MFTSTSLASFCLQFMAQGKAGGSSPPAALPKPGSQLDTMLGSLQSDLNKLGVATVAKGVCGACKKPIAGQVRQRNHPVVKIWATAGCNGEGCVRDERDRRCWRN